MDWNIVISIIAGLATAIPLVIKLVQYVTKAVKEKNWQVLLQLVMDLMAQAETMYDTGAEKKDWVMAMVKQAAKTINYDVDYDALSTLIDELCKMSKEVNYGE